MAHNNITRILIAGGMAVSAMAPGVASAIEWNITGLVREEISKSTSSNENEFNQSGNPYNGKLIPNFTNPNILTGKFSAPGGCNPGAGCNAAALAAKGAALSQDIPFNMFNTRLEVDIQTKWTEAISSYVKVRGYYDGTGIFSDAHLSQRFLADTGFGGARGNLLELQNNNVMLDLPAAYVDAHFGSLWLRAGQQQIAWGEALFFRVFDVVNGLDLRRHLFTDVAAEEYADERVASPSLRVSYTFSNDIEIDSFVQKFSPSIFPNTNTAYNVIPSAFTLESGDEHNKVENSLNFGARVIMPNLFAKDLTVQVMAVDRVNPDGVIRWDDAPKINPDGTPNPFCAGPNFFAGPTAPLADGSCGNFFNQDPTATASFAEWFHMAGRTHLNAVDGVATSVLEARSTAFLANVPAAFGGLQGLVTQAKNGSFTFAPGATGKAVSQAVLDSFFTGFGPLRGYITREFKREQIYGVGGNYIVTAEPGSLFDQLIIRGEMSYTPNKEFTDLRLSKHFVTRDEISASIVLEKYQSIFDAIPATYLVFEWLHKTESTLFGELLDGVDDRGLKDVDGRPNGANSADYVTFAFQQPFPNLIWRGDFAILVDVEGAAFMQPGLRYRPSSKWQFDLYANLVIDAAGGNRSALARIKDQDEVFARVSFFF